MGDSDYLNVIISVIVVVISIVLYLLYQKSKKSRRCILLVGLRESGKTLTFSQLIYGSYVDTFTSIKENVGEIEINNEMLTVVDIPGHEQLRYKFFDQYKSKAKAVVYVIDSSSLNSDNLRDTAECLYNIIADSVMIKNCVPILIMCNKQDISTALNYDTIKQKIEEEFGLLQITKSHQLESVDPKSKQRGILGVKGDKFKFENLPMKVTFGKTCAREEEESSIEIGIDDLKKWLTEVS